MIRSVKLLRCAVGVFGAIVTMLAVVALTGTAMAQALSSAAGTPLAAENAFVLRVSQNGDASRTLTWQIAEGYYLYRDRLDVKTADGSAVLLDTAPGIAMDDPTFGPVEVYFGSAEARMPPVSGSVIVTWQGCQDGGICYPPMQQTLAAAEVTPPISGGGDVTLARETGVIEGLQARGGKWMVLAGFLGFGVLLAFTPCVFPMFPILAGILGGQGRDLTPRRGAALSGAYVLAMASAFALFGVVAAWSGQNLQVALQSPVAIFLVAAIFVALALSSFGAFDLQLPQALAQRLSAFGARGRGTLGGAASLGFTSALVVGPCVTAPLAGALLYIAGTGDLALGAGALFALGLGQGVPLMIVGTLGAQVLPRAGAWMDAVKTIFGFVFLGMALWLLGRVLPGPAILALWSALLIGGGVFAGALDRLGEHAGAARRTVKTAGLLSILAGAIMAVGAGLGGSDPLRPLALLRGSAAGVSGHDALAFNTVREPAALEAALAAQPDQPVLVYVTADWCVTCRAIERNVWPDPGVRAALSGMTTIAADVSDFGPDGQRLLERLGAVGPPTMVFLDRDRVEPPATRIIGDTRPDAVRRSAEAVR